jgi:hypothetical protein
LNLAAITIGQSSVKDKSMGAKLKLMLIVMGIVLLLCGFSHPLVAQTNASPQSGERTGQSAGQRGDTVSSDFFVDTRPSGNSSTPSKPSSRARPSARTQLAPPKGKVFVKVGVTIGRGRPATEAEIKDHSLAKVSICAGREGPENRCIRWQDMVVERVSDDTPITDRTPVQMMIEYLAYRDAAGTQQAPDRVGYLYVINRVQFPDGTASSPKLIYPTRQTYGGNGIVVPGKPVMLPDPQRLWQINRNKTATQAFETYIIIVSPKPLKDSRGLELQDNNLGDNTVPLELDKELVKKWVQWWGGGVIRSDFKEGLGQLFTQREQSASGNPTATSRDTVVMDADLKQDDPRPQIGFHKAITPGGTILITIKLPFQLSP